MTPFPLLDADLSVNAGGYVGPWAPIVSASVLYIEVTPALATLIKLKGNASWAVRWQPLGTVPLRIPLLVAVLPLDTDAGSAIGAAAPFAFFMEVKGCISTGAKQLIFRCTNIPAP